METTLTLALSQRKRKLPSPSGGRAGDEGQTGVIYEFLE